MTLPKSTVSNTIKYSNFNLKCFLQPQHKIIALSKPDSDGIPCSGIRITNIYNENIVHCKLIYCTIYHNITIKCGKKKKQQTKIKEIYL